MINPNNLYLGEFARADEVELREGGLTNREQIAKDVLCSLVANPSVESIIDSPNCGGLNGLAIKITDNFIETINRDSNAKANNKDGE